MVLDSKIQQVKEHFGVRELSDWSTVRPAWILSLDGIGQGTLNQIRLHLAVQGMTLDEDRTPEYWRAKLERPGQAMADDQCVVSCPFTVLIDSQEQLPFNFQGIAADASALTADLRWRIREGIIQATDVKMAINTEWKPLGVSRGDYSYVGAEGRCHIERKSIDDAHGTILGWGERRERFERELEFLASIECAAIVVEGSFGQVLATVPARGKKTVDENRKILHRQVMAWQQDYRIPWFFCDSRRMAEVTTFRIMERHHAKSKAKAKQRVDQAQEVLASL